MEILLWLVPPAVVTLLAMAWVSWLGREGRGEVDREEAVRRLTTAMEKDLPGARGPRPAPVHDRSTGVAVRRSARLARPDGRPRWGWPDERLARMTQRTTAGLVAVLLLGALVAWTVFKPMPFVTYEPGQTINVLGENDGEEIIQVSGAKTYRDGGELRMTTVLVSTPGARLDLFTLMTDWMNPEKAVYPYDSVYAPETTQEENREEGQVDMVTSQDAATAAALRELGYEVTPVIEVTAVTPGTPADGELQVRDILARGRRHPDQDRRGRGEGRQPGPEGQAHPVQGPARRQGRQGRRDRDHADRHRRRPAGRHPDSGSATSSRST